MVQLGKTWRKLLILSMKFTCGFPRAVQKIAHQVFFLLHLKGDPTERDDGKICFGLKETFF